MLTDKERKELIEELRESAPDWTVSGRKVHLACDELERLAKENRKLQEHLDWLNSVALDSRHD